MKYLIIGTAGHVDHGKSALIKALTGVETDRLQEEKQRGISIDLGFASMQIADDIIAGIVDVPGHERFLKNMLAGTGGIDMAMLVIAADEGVMPQTDEHLAMLDLYGVRQGIVVLNKTDKVDAEWLEMVTEDVRKAVEGTFLATAPICPVSAISGAGLDELREVICETAKTIDFRDRTAPFRLWIDRAFNAHGYGTVVTGSVLSGTVEIGDTLTLYPAEREVRIRGLETHSQKTNRIYAGQRAAINITATEDFEAGRAMFLSDTARGEASMVWDIAIKWHDKTMPSGTGVRLHLGTGEYLGRLHGFKNQSGDYMRLIFEEKVVAGAGDRGILRLYSPQHLLGGVTMIAPGRPSRKMSAERLALAQVVGGSTRDLVQALIDDSPQPLNAAMIRRKAGYRPLKEINAALAHAVSTGKAVLLGQLYLSKTKLEKMTQDITAILGARHSAEPERAGLPREIIRRRMMVDEKAFEQLTIYWQDSGLMTTIDGDLALTAHAANYRLQKTDLDAQAAAAFGALGLVPINAELIAEKLDIKEVDTKRVGEILLKNGQLIKISDMMFHIQAIKTVITSLQSHFKEKKTITVAELRDLLGTSRKIAVPLMEYLDLQRYTIRRGDERLAGPKLKTPENDD